MSRQRTWILDWVAAGHLPQNKVSTALQISQAELTATNWLTFFRSFLLFTGIVSLALGIIFFFAYNWEQLGKLFKFALLECAFIATALSYVFCNTARNHSLHTGITVGMFMLTGALLALIGQTYQTGADPWQLFALWSLLTFPWVVFSRSSVLWVLSLGISQLAIYLYFHTFRGIWWLFSYYEQSLCLMLATSTVFAILLETLYHLRDRSLISLCALNNRYAAQISLIAAGTCTSILAFITILDWRVASPLYIVVYIAWLASCLYFYRFVRRDLLILSCCVLSLIILVVTLFARLLFETDFNAGSFFVLALITIAASTAGVFWLKKISGEA